MGSKVEVKVSDERVERIVPGKRLKNMWRRANSGQSLSGFVHQLLVEELKRSKGPDGKVSELLMTINSWYDSKSPSGGQKVAAEKEAKRLRVRAIQAASKKTTSGGGLNVPKKRAAND